MRRSHYILLLCGGLLALPASAQSVGSLDSAVRNCRQIEDRSARLDCYDGAIDGAAPAAPAQMSLSSPASQPAPSTSAADAVVAAPAQPAANSSQPAAKKGGFLSFLNGGGNNKKTYAIESVDTSHSWLVIKTKSGATWQQTDSKDFARLPEAGQTLTVGEAIAGKYVCQFGSEPFFYCKNP